MHSCIAGEMPSLACAADILPLMQPAVFMQMSQISEPVQSICAINTEAIIHCRIIDNGQKTSQNQPANASAHPNALEALRIVAPTAGTIVALDPDIPPANQRLQLVATGQGVRWRIDGKALGQGQQLSWFPWPGRHVLEVLDAQVRAEARLAPVFSICDGGALKFTGRPCKFF